jgi:lysozyme
VKSQEGMKTWLKIVEQTFCQPIIYTNLSFANEHFGKDFQNYPLWIAEYTTNSQPTLPKAWNLWSFWQYSEAGYVTGVNGHVDQDKFNGSVEFVARRLG